MSPRQAGTAQGLFPFINDEPHIWKVRGSFLSLRCTFPLAPGRHGPCPLRAYALLVSTIIIGLVLAVCCACALS